MTDSDLDRRRGVSVATRRAAEAARIAVAERAALLDAHDARARAHSSAIKEAKAEQARLAKRVSEHESELKKLAKERQQVEKAVDRSRKAAEQAERRAQKAESAYDKAVLRDMVEREKRADMMANSTVAGADRKPGGAPGPVLATAGAGSVAGGSARQPGGGKATPLSPNESVGGVEGVGSSGRPEIVPPEM